MSIYLPSSSGLFLSIFLVLCCCIRDSSYCVDVEISPLFSSLHRLHNTSFHLTFSLARLDRDIETLSIVPSRRLLYNHTYFSHSHARQCQVLCSCCLPSVDRHSTANACTCLLYIYIGIYVVLECGLRRTHAHCVHGGMVVQIFCCP